MKHIRYAKLMFAPFFKRLLLTAGFSMAVPSSGKGEMVMAFT
jgi:hypothetical protein